MPALTNEQIASSLAENWCLDQKLDPSRVYVASDSNFNLIGKMVGTLGAALNLNGFNRALKVCLEKNVFDLLPVEELPVPKGDAKHRLAEAGGIDQTNNRQSVTEIRSERAAKEAEARHTIRVVADKLAARFKADAQADDENITIFIESGPLAGKIDHGKTDAARKAARARAGRS